MRCTLLIVAGGCEACVRICYGSQAAAAQAGPSPSRGQRVLWGPLMCEAPTRRGGTVPLPAVRSWAARTSQHGSGAPEVQLRLGGRTDHARPRRVADGGRKPSSQQGKKLRNQRRPPTMAARPDVRRARVLAPVGGPRRWRPRRQRCLTWARPREGRGGHWRRVRGAVEGGQEARQGAVRVRRRRHLRRPPGDRWTGARRGRLYQNWRRT